VREPALAELAEPGLGAGFQEAELCRSQTHFAADIGGGLFLQVEAHQDFAFTLAHCRKNPQCDVAVLPTNYMVLWVGAGVE
jgi:hypothetical protein